MDKKSKAVETMRAYGASEKTVNEWMAKNAMDAFTAQYGERIPPGSYKVDVDYSSLELRVLNNPAWHPLPMDISVIDGLIENRLAFTARTTDTTYESFTVRVSQLDKGKDARIMLAGVNVGRALATLPDCDWLLPQLLAAREQHQADLWAIIKGE
ncbi:hypothetical protein POR1_51 [Pseudomonas phage POR1]|uniref:Uncharacterized protein n=1 Tax=Pseudomonas phage POR1 TaxID=1718594 RepID=A0A0N9SG46_9CAUD|nr:hypothetical protein POR1_51 [Pseudomonas phage POR1]